jgi:hypothetical protein
MSIGEIITTPQGLAVVVEVLPTSFKVGSYTLGQVVAEPLTGGPETVPSGAPAPGAEPLTLYQAIQSQAAALYVASVVETQLIPFARDSAALVEANSDNPVALHTSVARAYQTTQEMAGHTRPRIVVRG